MEVGESVGRAAGVVSGTPLTVPAREPSRPCPISVPGCDSDGIGHVVTQGRQGTKAPLPSRNAGVEVGGRAPPHALPCTRPRLFGGSGPFLPAAGPVLPLGL